MRQIASMFWLESSSHHNRASAIEAGSNWIFPSVPYTPMFEAGLYRTEKTVIFILGGGVTTSLWTATATRQDRLSYVLDNKVPSFLFSGNHWRE